MNTPENLVDQINRLIRIIQNTINDRKSTTPRKKIWEKPEAWLEVIIYLKKLSRNYKHKPKILAKMVIGLDRYLDYFSLHWATSKQAKDIKDLVNDLIQNALSLYSHAKYHYSKKISGCGHHEDKACELRKLSPRFTSSPLNLPLNAAVNFWSPYILKRDLNNYPNLEIIRVIDNKNNPYGSYWLIGTLPHTRKCWRSRYAVLTQWSKGTKYVKLNIHRNILLNIECWIGFAASQPVPSKKCILYGGWRQAWIPLSVINQLRRKNFVTKPRNINHW